MCVKCVCWPVVDSLNRSVGFLLQIGTMNCMSLNRSVDQSFVSDMMVYWLDSQSVAL